MIWWWVSRRLLKHFVTYLLDDLSDIQGILGEADGRGGEQLEGAVAARARHCSTDHVHVYVTFVLSQTLNNKYTLKS